MKNNTIKKLFLNWLSLTDNLQAEKILTTIHQKK